MKTLDEKIKNIHDNTPQSITDMVCKKMDELDEFDHLKDTCDVIQGGLTADKDQGMKAFFQKQNEWDEKHAHDMILNNMEESNRLERSEIWYMIYDIVKQIPRKEVQCDAVDAPSATTMIEELFLKLLPTYEDGTKDN